MVFCRIKNVYIAENIFYKGFLWIRIFFVHWRYSVIGQTFSPMACVSFWAGPKQVIIRPGLGLLVSQEGGSSGTNPCWLCSSAVLSLLSPSAAPFERNERVDFARLSSCIGEASQYHLYMMTTFGADWCLLRCCCSSCHRGKLKSVWPIAIAMDGSSTTC